MPDAVAAAPDLASSEWAVMTDAELDEAAAMLARFVPLRFREQLKETAHLADDSHAGSVTIYRGRRAGDLCTGCATSRPAP